jgi:hypothetical protein
LAHAVRAPRRDVYPDAETTLNGQALARVVVGSTLALLIFVLALVPVVPVEKAS